MWSVSSPSDQEDFSFIGNARREQIKAAAIDTIVELGYAKASLAQIAKRAGISKGVISYHFAGKDELMEKLVTEFYLAGAHYMLPKLEAQATKRDLLRVYIEASVEYVGANRHSIRAIAQIFSNFRTADGKPRFGKEDNDDVVETVAVILREGQESGEFRDFDSWVMASSLRAAIDMISGEFEANPELDPTHYASELVTIFDRATRKDTA